MTISDAPSAAAEGRPATLREVLSEREDRARRQKILLSLYGESVISFTPVAPGPEKTGPRFRKIHEAWREAILEALFRAGIRVRREESRSCSAGYESLFAVAGMPWEVKRLVTAIEDNHPAGRLFDIDVVAGDGVPVSRVDFGLSRRSCLLCGGPSGDCARSRAHQTVDLLARIDAILDAVSGGSG